MEQSQGRLNAQQPYSFGCLAWQRPTLYLAYEYGKYSWLKSLGTRMFPEVPLPRSWNAFFASGAMPCHDEVAPAHVRP